MQFTGRLTEEDLTDVGKMTRSKTYWPKLLLTNLYGAALLLILMWATIAGFLRPDRPNWRAIAAIWVLVVGLVLWVGYRTRRARARELKQLNATLADQIGLTNDGVKFDGPNGATAFQPWRNFKGWREGRRVVLVDLREGSRFVMLPVAQLSEIERQSVRQFLQSHIPTLLSQ